MSPWHGMACVWIVDRRDCLQMWRVVAYISNKQLWTAQKGWFFGLGVG